MLFGMKNGPLTYQKVLTKAFREYLDNFMKIFLDDFIMYIDMESHLHKLRLCFQKCKKYGFSLNPDKCAFMVFSRMILSFIVSKEVKLPYLEDTSNNKHATTQKFTINSSIQSDDTILQMFYQKLCCCYYGAINTKIFPWTKKCQNA
jgi:hypothetical protein